MVFGICSSVNDILLSVTEIWIPGGGDLDAGGDPGRKPLQQLFP